MGSLILPDNRKQIVIKMRRRCNENVSDDGPPKKKNCINPVTSSFRLGHGEFLKDISGKQWKLGKAVGVGGFGEIYLASDNLTKEVRPDSEYVAKVESHQNGPLFVEVNCYLRIAKPDMIKEWKRKRNLSSLGMPHYVASGSHIHKSERYRFLILPKFDKDLEKLLQEKKMLNLKSVLTISLQIMDVLEYIHSKGYIHSDVKASNILLSNNKVPKEETVPKKVENKYSARYQLRTCRMQKRRILRDARNLRPQPLINYNDDILHLEESLTDQDDNTELKKPRDTRDQVYLLDYGLASKYLTSDGKHKPYCWDERKAHAGTILFCSRDAHRGVQGRRSDLESLGYNIIYWLTGNLPWSNDVDNPEIVEKKKLKAMTDIVYFLRSCFNEYPKFLEEYFKYLQNLQFQEKPDYDYCKRLFKQSLKANGYKDDSFFDFDNVHHIKKLKTKKMKRISENIKAPKLIFKMSRLPLQSNIPVKPLLRRKIKNNKPKKRTNWFEDIADPEVILKQAQKKKNIEHNNDSSIVANISELNISVLNPTYAMREVYNKCIERGDVSPAYKGDSCLENVNGYTYAMMSVLKKIKKRKELKFEQVAVNLSNTRNGTSRFMSRRKKKFESLAKPSPQTRTTKSAMVVKRDNFQGRKVKDTALRRTYSLRG